jgi:hypothetical protein
MNATKYIARVVLTVVLLTFFGIVQAQETPVAERVDALKATLAASQKALHQYQWEEATVVTLKGEQKSSKQQNCYYGADGTIKKVEVSTSPAPKEKRGIRGRIIENKKEEMTAYMQNAVALVKTYVPPNPEKIQAVKDAGNAELNILKPDQRARLVFKNYEKPGDSLSIDIDLKKNIPVSLKVDTYLDDASDAVTLNVTMDQLEDGTVYTSGVTLDAVAKQLVVTVQNSGYRLSTN